MKGILRWYTSPLPQHTVRELLAALDADGLTLANPVTGQVSVLSVEAGREGDQIPTSRADLERDLASLAKPLTFQLWLSGSVDSVDIVCQFRPLEQFVAQTYHFDGLVLDEAERVIGAVSRHIGRAPIETVALLIDRTSSWEDIDYDRLVLDRAPKQRQLPASLLIVAD